MKSILVLCTGNSCRSQMAEGWLKHFSKGKLEVYSAGIETHGVNPRAAQVMQEAGISIADHSSDIMDKYLDINFDIILTVCDNAKDNCPVFPGEGKRIHHSFPDPAGAVGNEEEILKEFRRVRDLIKEYCQELVIKI